MKEAEVNHIDTSDKVNEDISATNPLINHRYKGKIFQLSTKGWGFIASNEIQFRRIYFYWSSLDPFGTKFEELNKGDEVEFEASEYIDKRTGKNMGYRAYKIKVIDK